MNEHLAEIATQAAADAMPGTEPQENVWQFLRDNWLSNLIFTPYDNIADQCCRALNRLINELWHFVSIRLRESPDGF